MQCMVCGVYYVCVVWGVRHCVWRGTALLCLCVCGVCGVGCTALCVLCVRAVCGGWVMHAVHGVCGMNYVCVVWGVWHCVWRGTAVLCVVCMWCVWWVGDACSVWCVWYILCVRYGALCVERDWAVLGSIPQSESNRPSCPFPNWVSLCGLRWEAEAAGNVVNMT